MASETLESEILRLRQENDLYIRLLDLGRQDGLDPFLREALVLMTDVVGARQGYLELRDDTNGSTVEWSASHGFSPQEVEHVRAAISRGIISRAIATGQTIITPSAISDPRFEDRESVVMHGIGAVLCAPIGVDPPRGVLYLQGRRATGVFTEEDRARAETFARHLASFVDRLLTQQRIQTRTDPTSALRQSLRLDDVIGRSEALAAVLKEVALVAPLDINVLLTGESGTGKSQLANLIHDSGPRAKYPFVELNCAAIPVTLLESELFGAMPGSHATATRRIEGKVAAADHGTLFLDEISELSIDAQAKLLQLLQSRIYYPLGATKPVHADVRVIAATNTDLETAVSERRFREDLLYRLQVLPIRVPTLAERREDIPELAAYFCETACRRHRFPHLRLSHNAVRAAVEAVWPGNIRQLANCVEAAVIRAAGEGASQVEARHLFPDDKRPEASGEHVTFQEGTREYQKKLVTETLNATGWNVQETARRLDVARSHLYSLIRAFGLTRAHD